MAANGRADFGWEKYHYDVRNQELDFEHYPPKDLLSGIWRI